MKKTYIVSDARLNELIKIKDENWIDFDLKTKDESFLLEKTRITKVHKLTSINPDHSEPEFESLLRSIALNGQLEPVKIWAKGGSKWIIDGKHRYKALLTLGIEYIKYVIIPTNTSLEDIKKLIIESECKRQMTSAQKSIRAWRDYIENHKVDGKQMIDYASQYSTNKSGMSRCNTISERFGKKVLDDIWETRKTKIDGKYFSSLGSIVSYIEELDADKEPKTPPPEGSEKLLKLANDLYNSENIGALHYCISDLKSKAKKLNNKLLD